MDDSSLWGGTKHVKIDFFSPGSWHKDDRHALAWQRTDQATLVAVELDNELFMLVRLSLPLAW